MPTGLVKVIVLHEHGGGEHHVGIPSRVGQELLVDGEEEILARETPVHPVGVGSDHGGIGVLDEHGGEVARYDDP